MCYHLSAKAYDQLPSTLNTLLELEVLSGWWGRQ